MNQLPIKQQSLAGLLKQQLLLHKKYEVQDFYKFLFQAALGCEHAVSDESLSFQHLKVETAELSSFFSEPLIEQLAPDGRLIRVNLRPYVMKGGDLGLLNKNFFKTAADFRGSSIILEEYWQQFRNFTRQHIPEIDPLELDRFWQDICSQGFPAVHHSSDYKEQNKPAYRVVLIELMRDELKRII